MLKRKLLLADDSITIQKVVNLTFADEGIEVISVGNGSQAVEKLEEVAPDLVLADVHMPGLSGYEVCEKVRSHGRFGKIPVILLVGSFEPFDEQEAARVGADAHLIKPFQSIRQLVSKVTELLDAGKNANGSAMEEYQPPTGTSFFEKAPAENESAFTAGMSAADKANDTNLSSDDVNLTGSDRSLKDSFLANTWQKLPETGSETPQFLNETYAAGKEESEEKAEEKPSETSFTFQSDSFSYSFETPGFESSSFDDELMETSRPNVSGAAQNDDVYSAYRSTENSFSTADKFTSESLYSNENKSAEDSHFYKYSLTTESSSSNGNQLTENAVTNENSLATENVSTKENSSADSPANEFKPQSAYLESPGQVRVTAPLSLNELTAAYPELYAAENDSEKKTAEAEAFFSFQSEPFSAQTQAQNAPLDKAKVARVSTEPPPLNDEYSFSFTNEVMEQPVSHSLNYEDNRSEMPEPPVEMFKDDDFELELDHLRPFFGSTSFDDEAILEIKTDTLSPHLVEEYMNEKSAESAEEIARRESEMEKLFALDHAPASAESEMKALETTNFAAEIEQAGRDSQNDLSQNAEQSTELTLAPPRAVSSLMQFPPEVIDAIAQRVIEKLSDRVVREIAWEVVPELSELLIKKYMDKDMRRR